MREPQSEPHIGSLDITEVQRDLVSLVHDVTQEQSRVLVEEDGVPVAAIIPLADYRQLARLDAQIAERRRVVEAIQESFSDVPPDELEREIAKAVAEVRAEMKTGRRAANRA
jgi:PHD/YefM family antitoxin component YafN of YafNO toxin-antitoxin module